MICSYMLFYGLPLALSYSAELLRQMEPASWEYQCVTASRALTCVAAAWYTALHPLGGMGMVCLFLMFNLRTVNLYQQPATYPKSNR